MNDIFKKKAKKYKYKYIKLKKKYIGEGGFFISNPLYSFISNPLSNLFSNLFSKTDSQTDPNKTNSQTDPNKTNSQTDPNKTNFQTDPNKTNSQTDPNKTNSQTDSKLINNNDNIFIKNIITKRIEILKERIKYVEEQYIEKIKKYSIDDIYKVLVENEDLLKNTNINSPLYKYKYDIYKLRIEAIKQLEIFQEVKKLQLINKTTDENELKILLTNKDYNNYKEKIINRISYIEKNKKIFNNIKNFIHCILDFKILDIIIKKIEANDKNNIDQLLICIHNYDYKEKIKNIIINNEDILNKLNNEDILKCLKFNNEKFNNEKFNNKQILIFFDNIKPPIIKNIKEITKIFPETIALMSTIALLENKIKYNNFILTLDEIKKYRLDIQK